MVGQIQTLLTAGVPPPENIVVTVFSEDAVIVYFVSTPFLPFLKTPFCCRILLLFYSERPFPELPYDAAVMILTTLLLVLTILLAVVVILPVFFGAPWHPTSIKQTKAMLEFCEAKPGEKLYDLGSGDGRILMVAAKHYGLKGVGLEIDPIKVGISRLLLRWMGLKGQVQIFRKNVFHFDYSDADILFIYLSHQALDRLFPAILDQLKPETRIICFRFCPRGMTPTKVNADKTIFLYQLHKGNKLNQYS